MSVEMVDIHKSFGTICALDGANIAIGDNEIVGLVGDNAAGKSTLMKVLSGAYKKDSGTILFDTCEAEINNPKDARSFGIEMVYQDFALAGNLDVTGNVYMGRELSRWTFLQAKKMATEARSLIERLGVDIENVGQVVESMSGGQRQIVAIARAMAFDTRVVIMDEPTASLSQSASKRIMDIVLQLKDHGVSVVYISHRLDEVDRIADRVVRMSHGRMLDA